MLSEKDVSHCGPCIKDQDWEGCLLEGITGLGSVVLKFLVAPAVGPVANLRIPFDAYGDVLLELGSPVRPVRGPF